MIATDTSEDSPQIGVIAPDAIDESRQLVVNGLKAMVLGSGLAVSEKDLKAWFQETLKLSYSAAWRKLAGEASWDEGDLQKVAAGLGMTLKDLLLSLSCGGTRIETANIEIASIPMYVKVVLGSKLTNIPDHGLVAYAKDNEWHVVDIAHIQRLANIDLFQVLSINLTESVERTRLIALVDDDDSVTKTASELFKLEGLNSRSFNTEEGFLRALRTTKFEAFVVDWFLAPNSTDGTSKTTEQLIRRIRESPGGKTAPIIIVTGETKNDDDALVGELTRVSREYDCSSMIKPVRWRFVAADLVKRLANPMPYG